MRSQEVNIVGMPICIETLFLHWRKNILVFLIYSFLVIFTLYILPMYEIEVFDAPDDYGVTLDLSQQLRIYSRLYNLKNDSLGEFIVNPWSLIDIYLASSEFWTKAVRSDVFSANFTNKLEYQQFLQSEIIDKRLVIYKDRKKEKYHVHLITSDRSIATKVLSQLIAELTHQLLLWYQDYFNEGTRLLQHVHDDLLQSYLLERKKNKYNIEDVYLLDVSTEFDIARSVGELKPVMKQFEDQIIDKRFLWNSGIDPQIDELLIESDKNVVFILSIVILVMFHLGCIVIWTSECMESFFRQLRVIVKRND